MTRDEAAPGAGYDPLTLLSGLVLDTGHTWGSNATAWQRADASAILTTSPDAPRRHYALRARGMSKTTDVAGVSLALLLTQAPPRSRSHAYAVDGDQARILLDTMGGLVARSGLAGLVDVTGRSVTVKRTGASLVVESSDGASAYGLRPWLTVCDELGMWPRTSNYRNLWAAITSAVPKVPGARLVAIGTAGSPTSLGAKVWEEASASRHWRTSLRPGPAPWWNAADIESTKADLTAAEYRRLILCEWAEGDDALTSPEDVMACLRAGEKTLPPRNGVEYVAALDVGTRRDLTGLAIGHAEIRPEGRVVVIDRVMHWRPPSGGGRVDLAEVEETLLRVCRQYRVSRLRFDRMQAEQMTGNLARAGINTLEYVFSSAGADRLARALYVGMRDHTLDLPDDDELRNEALSVRMVETGPGTVKMSNPAGAHDDVLTAVGMVVVDILGRQEIGRGSIGFPRGKFTRPTANPTPRLPMSAARLRMAVGDRALHVSGVGGGALLIPGSANDPRWRA